MEVRIRKAARSCYVVDEKEASRCRNATSHPSRKRHRQRLRKPSSITSYFIFVLVFYTFPRAKVASSVPTSKTPTRVLGFANSKQLTSLTSDAATPVHDKAHRLHVQHLPSEGALLLKAGDKGTIRIGAHKEKFWDCQVLDETGNTTTPEAWTPIEGLFGVYQVPSGTLWVLVTKSESVYDEPLQIRRVTDLELIHVSCRLLSASQLKEEVRQVQLMRKALKQHSFYYVDNTYPDSMLPDMTKNLQRSFQQKRNLVVNSSEDILSRTNTTLNTTLLRNHENNTDSTTNDNLLIDAPRGNQSSCKLWWEHPDSKDDAMRPDPRFFWNEVAMEPLIRRYHATKTSERDGYGLLLTHMLPLTSAFVGVQRGVEVSNSSNVLYDQLLISRRSRFRAGTRFTKRGADGTGAVANYAETEQLCLLFWPDQKRRKKKNKSPQTQYTLRKVWSHVQTRGSIPLRWSSPTDIKTYRPRVLIGTDPMAQTRALLVHILEQLQLYAPSIDDKNLTSARLIFVNLIDKKSDQGRLGRTFDEVLKAVLEVYTPPVNPPVASNKNKNCSQSQKAPQEEDIQRIVLTPNSVEHIWYDFHAEVKNGRWHRLAKLLKQLHPALLEHGSFSVERSNNGSEWNLHCEQKAVVRTNCMDCLDRTNVVQSLFGRDMLFQQLRDQSSKQQDISDPKVIPASFVEAYKENPLTLPWENGELAHRHLWADNADAISQLYAGTPALKGDFTRTGKRTKRGALDDGMNSLQRYYLNNFLDADRQEGTDLMVGYASFSNLDADDSKVGNEKTGDAGVLSSMSLQEAARQMLLGNNVFKQSQDDDESNYARIKQYESHPYLRQSLDRVVGGASPDHANSRKHRRHRRKETGLTRPLDLRWLPGDLQDHMRNRAAKVVTAPSTKDEFNPANALLAIDRRSASDEPWWVLPDSSDVDEACADTARENSRLNPCAKHIHAGYVLSSLLIGTQRPILMALIVVVLLGAINAPSDAESNHN